ncbi:MAG: GYD domain-containing protein [Streptosporangiaceae bacterium]
MSKYMFTAHYSNASWARLVQGSDDRAVAFDTLLRSLGGSLDVIYWTVRDGAARAIADLPDAMAAKAVVTAIVKTGAFSAVEVDELLSQDQLRDTLMLARSAEPFYEAPGHSAVALQPSAGD